MTIFSHASATNGSLNMDAERAKTLLSRRGFCLCCVVATGFAATGGWLTPSQAFAEARNLVDVFRDDAAKARITTHKLRGNIPLWASSAVFALIGLSAYIGLLSSLSHSTQNTLAGYSNLVKLAPRPAYVLDEEDASQRRRS